jgi:hypothetical protein
MREVLPWLIGAWILFGRKPAPPGSSTSKPATSPTSPPPVAYLYQLPTDSYETVRVAVGRQPDDAIDRAPPKEVGIFANEAAALALLVHPKGYALAWPGVKQLAAPP